MAGPEQLFLIGSAIAADWDGTVLEQPLIVVKKCDRADLSLIREELKRLVIEQQAKMLSYQIVGVDMSGAVETLEYVTLASSTEFMA